MTFADVDGSREALTFGAGSVVDDFGVCAGDEGGSEVGQGAHCERLIVGK